MRLEKPVWDVEEFEAEFVVPAISGALPIIPAPATFAPAAATFTRLTNACA